MQIDYPTRITESADELLRLERRHRGSPLGDRVKMLRLLKTRAYPSRLQLSRALGYSHRQLQRWWNAYQRGGLQALLDRASPGGSRERITSQAWTALEAEMKAGRIATLKQAQGFLAERFAIAYSIGGLSDLFRRRKTKLKTGRRRHTKASDEEQAAFKKPVRGRGAGTAPGAVLRDG